MSLSTDWDCGRDLDTALARVGVRDGQANEFEQRDALQKCHDIFAGLQDDFIHRIDAARTPDEVHQSILAVLAK